LTFALPRVSVPHIVQSVAASFVSTPLGKRQIVRIASFESSFVAGSAVPSTSDTGAVKPGNIAEMMASPDIDGALVGGASIDAYDYAAIASS
jgi:hypothetical protein